MTEIFLSFADDTAVDVAKIGGVAVEVVETEAVVLADPTSGEVVDHLIDVEEVVTSGVVILEETRAMAEVELWPESVGAEAAIQGVSDR